MDEVRGHYYFSDDVLIVLASRQDVPDYLKQLLAIDPGHRDVIVLVESLDLFVDLETCLVDRFQFSDGFLDDPELREHFHTFRVWFAGDRSRFEERSQRFLL